MQAKLFVGSSSEGLPIAKQIVNGAKAFCTPTLWTDIPVFQAGEQTIESIARIAPILTWQQ